MKLKNPCSISELITYARSVPQIDDNDAINRLFYELNRLSSETIEKRTICAIFQLFQYYVTDKYIDIGCMVLAIMTQPKNIYHNIFIDIKKGKVGITNNCKPNFNEINDISNNLKQLIAEAFI
jgi:hypothetical protein